MKKLLMVLILSCIMVSMGAAQTITVEIATSMTDGKWDTGRPLAWTLETDADGVPVVYTDAQVPDHNCLSTKDIQTWYVDVGGVWHKYTFSAKAESLKGQYAIKVSVDNEVSDWVSKYLGKPRNPRSG